MGWQAGVAWRPTPDRWPRFQPILKTYPSRTVISPHRPQTSDGFDFRNQDSGLLAQATRRQSRQQRKEKLRQWSKKGTKKEEKEPY